MNNISQHKITYTGRTKGFTLSETLVTLSILGVVAALLIPNVIKHYQNIVFYTGLRKSYSILQSVNSIFAAENGNYSKWINEIPEEDKNNIGLLYAEKIEPYLNLSQSCYGIGCWGTKPESLDGNSTWLSLYAFNDTDSKTLILKDNMTIAIKAYGGANSDAFLIPKTGQPTIIFFVDVNGRSGPNRIGRDVFIFGLCAYGYYARWITNFKENQILPAGYSLSDKSENCKPGLNSDKNGFSCASRILMEDMGIKY